MSKTVDSRVVEMKFDNKNFESNVRTTMSTLEKLKSSLKLDGASKSLEGINAAAKNVNFDNIARGVASLESRFSTFGIVGMRVIENLTDSAMNFISKISSFLTSGIVQGGINRAMNLEKAHFQLQGLLKDEAQVSAIMDNVNASVDGTAYSLDNAALVASQFAATGMRAGEKMEGALRAVAGTAAMTGADYSRVGMIFTQVAGQGRLMGNDLLQLSTYGVNAAATLATHFGKTEAEIRDMVSKGQVSFEMFAEAMDSAFGEHAAKANETLTGALSNVKAALARIGAEFVSPLVEQNGVLVKFFNTLREKVNEAKKEVGPFATEFVTNVSTVVKALTDFTSKLDMANIAKSVGNGFVGLMNIIKAIGSALKPIKDAFVETFEPTAEKLKNLTENFKIFTSNLKLSDKTADNLKNTFKGLFAVIHIISQAFSAVVKGVASLFGGFGDLSGGILSITGAFGKFLSNIDRTITKSEIFSKIIQGLVGVIKTVAGAIKDFIKSIGENLNFHPLELLEKILDNINDRFKQVTEAGVKFGDSLAGNKILLALQSLWDGIKKIGSAIASGLSTIMQGLIDGLGGSKFNSLMDLFNTASFGAIAVAITKFVKSVKEPFESLGGLKDILKGVTDILNGVKDCLKAYQEQLKAGTLLKIAGAIGILAASLLVIASIDSNKLSGALTGITMLFVDLMGAMAVMEKLDVSGLQGVSKSIAFMIGISISVLLLASALKKLGSLDLASLTKGVIGIATLMGTLVGAMKLMSTDSGEVVKGATQMAILAVAVKILASACEDLSKFSWEELAKGISGVGAILLEFVGFQALMQLIDINGMLKSATSLAIIAVAMEIFANVCSKFGSMDWESLGKAITAIAGVLLEFVSFQSLMQLIDSDNMVKSVLSLVTVGAAMEIFANVCTKFGKMDWESLGKAAASLAVVLVEFIGFQALMQLIDTDNMVKSVLSLVAVGAAMEIFANVCSKFGSMDWESLAKSGVAMTGILVLVTGFAALAGMTSSIISSAASLLIMAVALRIFTPVLTSLGDMSLGSIAKGLLALAGAFAILGVAGLLLGPLAPAILALAGAIALMGVGVMATGVGITLLAAGITALATALAGGAVAIASGLAVIITGIANLIPLIIAKIGEGIVAFCRVISESAPAIGEAIKSVVLTVIDVLVECIPQLVEGLFQLFIQVLDGLIEYGPQIGERLATIVIGFIDFLTEKAPEFIEHVFSLLIAIIDGVSSQISRLVDPIVNLISSVLNAVFEAIGPIIKNVIEPLLNFLKDLIVGVMEAIGPYLPAISDAIARVAEAIGPAIESIANAFNTLFSQIAPIINSITGLIQQLGNSISQILYALAAVISTIGNTISQILISIGSVFDTVFNGIANVVTSVGNAISDSLNSLATVFDSVFSGIADVIRSVGDSIKSVLDGIADIIDSIGNAALNAGNGFKSLAEGVQIITNLNIVDMAASMAAVALALGDIASKSSGLAEAGSGMQQIASGTQMSASAFNSMAMGISIITSLLSAIGPTASAAMSILVSSVTSSASCFNAISTAASSAVASVNASLLSIGSGAASFQNSIVGLTVVMNSVMSSMVNVVVNASGRISSAVVVMMTALARTVVSSGVIAVTALNSVMTRMVSMAMSRAGLFHAVGVTLMMQFKMGLTSGLNGVTTAIQSALTSCVGAIRSFQSSFAGAGKDLGQGLVSGINSKQQAAYNAGYALGQKAVQGEKDGQKSNSPSKLTIKAGKWIGEGLVIGMNHMGKAVYNAGKSMGSNAVNSINKTLDDVGNMFYDIDNVQPKISPIVDMSNIQYKTFDLQLGANLGNLVSNPVNSLANVVSDAQTKIDASNMEVVSAVNGLRDDLNTLYSDSDQEIALYVDAKQLASSIAKPMNRQLNIISRRERGL